MRKRKRMIVGWAFAMAVVPFVAGQKGKPGTASPAQIARGKYLVENIAFCGDCHTPNNDKGEPEKEKWLQGATLDFKPMQPVPNWAYASPNIAGLPGWEKGAAIKFLMTGIGRNGLPARPPMPQFRLNLQDAEAVVAYLKNLPPPK